MKLVFFAKLNFFWAPFGWNAIYETAPPPPTTMGPTLPPSWSGGTASQLCRRKATIPLCILQRRPGPTPVLSPINILSTPAPTHFPPLLIQRGVSSKAGKGLWTLQRGLWKANWLPGAEILTLAVYNLHWEQVVLFFLRNSKILKAKKPWMSCISLSGIVQISLSRSQSSWNTHTHHVLNTQENIIYHFIFFKSVVSRYSKTETKNSNFHNIPWFCNKFHQPF